VLIDIAKIINSDLVAHRGTKINSSDPLLPTVCTSSM
jgi:hypothetical protein